MAATYAIASWGKDHLTASTVDQLLAGGADPSEVIVVDNLGTCVLPDGVQVIRPARNLGWLIATNVAMQRAFADPACDACVWLNNDLTLAPGFVDGMAAGIAHGAWLTGPLYDGMNAHQRPAEPVELDAFQPVDAVRSVQWVEGTCLAVSREAYEHLGPMDARRFGARGWGGDIDYALRTAAAGGEIVITEAALLHHIGGATAHEADHGEYHRRARRELTFGMRGRWGDGWVQDLGLDVRPPDDAGPPWRVRLEELAGAPMRRLLVGARLRAARGLA